MNNIMRTAFVVSCGIMLAMSFVACGDDDDSKGGNSGNGSATNVGWYARSDIQSRVMSSLDSWNKPGDCYCSANSQGVIQCYITTFGTPTEPSFAFSDADAYFTWETFYNIVDNNTIVKYTGAIYEYGASAAAGKKLLYKFNYGSLGTLALYAVSTQYYTYWIEDNKMYTTEYEIYTITSSGLIPDGSSYMLAKYNPEDTHY